MSQTSASTSRSGRGRAFSRRRLPTLLPSLFGRSAVAGPLVDGICAFRGPVRPFPRNRRNARCASPAAPHRRPASPCWPRSRAAPIFVDPIPTPGHRGREVETGANVLNCDVGEVGEQVHLGHAARQRPQGIRDAHLRAFDRGASAADGGVDHDPRMVERIHTDSPFGAIGAARASVLMTNPSAPPSLRALRVNPEPSPRTLIRGPPLSFARK